MRDRQKDWKTIFQYINIQSHVLQMQSPDENWMFYPNNLSCSGTHHPSPVLYNPVGCLCVRVCVYSNGLLFKWARQDNLLFSTSLWELMNVTELWVAYALLRQSRRCRKAKNGSLLLFQLKHTRSAVFEKCIIVQTNFLPVWASVSCTDLLSRSITVTNFVLLEWMQLLI